jgi:hypothetical protein
MAILTMPPDKSLVKCPCGVSPERIRTGWLYRLLLGCSVSTTCPGAFVLTHQKQTSHIFMYVVLGVEKYFCVPTLLSFLYILALTIFINRVIFPC